MQLIKKLVGCFLVTLTIFLSFSNVIFAQNKNNETATPSSEITSFELFWPIVAGKTIDDPLYGLKTLKEKVREFFIFGKAQKADYHIFLVTKRVVEAEKLIGEGKKELAIKTLDKAIAFLKSAGAEVSEASGELSSSEAEDNINKQLKNLEIFIPVLASQLISQDDSLAGKLQDVLSAIETF